MYSRRFFRSSALRSIACAAISFLLVPACMLLVTVGLLGLLVTIDLPRTLEGVRTPPLFRKNPMHAGVGSGLLSISAIFLLLYALETGRLRGQWRWPIIALSVATAFL